MRCEAGRTACLSSDGINLPARHHYEGRDSHLRERLREVSQEWFEYHKQSPAFLSIVRGEK